VGTLETGEECSNRISSVGCEMNKLKVELWNELNNVLDELMLIADNETRAKLQKVLEQLAKIEEEENG
jgi:hypothetical protein